MNLPKDHPFANLNLQHLPDWNAWKQAWNEAALFEVKHALLGMGFELAREPAHYQEAVKLSLAFADGYRKVTVTEQTCSRPDDSRTGIGRFNFDQAPMHLAYKAKQELDHHVFNEPWSNVDDGRSKPRWFGAVVEDPEVLEAFVRFFRTQPSDYRGLEFVNRIDRDDDTLLRAFVIAFAQFVAEYRYDRGYGREKMDAFVETHLQPKLVTAAEWLVAAGDLNMLRRPAFCTAAVAQRLEDLALTKKIYKGSDYAAPKSLDEAIAYSESWLAPLVQTLKTTLTIRTRDAELAELEHQKRALEHRQRELSAP